MLFFVPVDNGHVYGPLDFFFEARSRYEVRNTIDFDGSGSDDLTTWNNRGRIGFNYDTGDEHTNVRVTYQYTRSDFDADGVTSDITCQDLIEAFAENRWDHGHGLFRVGRQRLDIGSGRLIGSNQWSDTGRYWNGLRLENGSWQFFTGRLDMDRMGVGQNYLLRSGYHWQNAGHSNLLYVWDHHDKSIYTLAHEWEKHFGHNAKVIFEGAFQWGREHDHDLEAWGFSVEGEVDVSDRLWFFGGYTSASGGTAADGTVNTFDDLFPSDHKFEGMMDLQAWRNVNTFNVGAGFRVNEDVSLSVAYYDFKLNDATDDWYNGTNFTGNQYAGFTPNGSDDVGTEIDVKLKWRLQEHLKLSAGFAVFDPGTFISNQAGGFDSNQTYFYSSVGWKF